MPAIISALVWAAGLIVRCLPGIALIMLTCLAALVWCVLDWRIRPPPGWPGRHNINLRRDFHG